MSQPPRSSESTSSEPEQNGQFRVERCTSHKRNHTLFDYHRKRILPKLARVLEYAMLQGDGLEVWSKLASCNWKIEGWCRSCYRQQGAATKDSRRLIVACGNKLTDADHTRACRSTCAWSGSVLATIRRAAGGGGARGR
jgi:hypothetical protein